MKNCRKKSLKASNGITLIALVITIIVILILAGISISMLAGDNSILQKATDAKEITERKSVIESAQTDILGQIAENKGETITETQLKTILGKYFEEFDDELPEDLSETTITLTAKTEYGGYTNIALSDIYKGLISKERISNLKSITLFDIKEQVEVTIYFDDTIITWQNFIDSDFSNSDWTLVKNGRVGNLVYYKGRKLLHDSSVVTYPDDEIEDFSDYFIQ